ncbi:response regulator [bacterium]|nr:response regulator [bacterium]
MIRVIIVDDQQLIRDGLKTLISLEEDIEVVAEASDGREAVLVTERMKPDIVLMDIQMPVTNGIEAAREILTRFEDVKVLMLTTFIDDQYIIECLKVGASGYLLKNMPSELLVSAIRGIKNGLTQIDNKVADRLTQFLVNPSTTSNVENFRFKERELEVLRLLAIGHSNKQIAQELHITEGTVKNYVSNILMILGVEDRTKAALWAAKNLA